MLARLLAKIQQCIRDGEPPPDMVLHKDEFQLLVADLKEEVVTPPEFVIQGINFDHDAQFVEDLMLNGISLDVLDSMSARNLRVNTFDVNGLPPAVYGINLERLLTLTM